MGEPEPHPLLAKATASLATRLAPMAFDTTASEVTTLLTVEIARWAEDHGFDCQREVRPSRGGGRIDLVGVHPASHRLAIEIDRTSTVRSLRKLLVEAHAGAIPIWVRWCTPCPFALPHAVGLVELRADHSGDPGEYAYRYRRTPYLDWPTDKSPRKPYYRTIYQPPRDDVPAEAPYQLPLFRVRHEMPRARHVPPTRPRRTDSD